MTRTLTQKQEDLLNYTIEYIGDKGYPPSIREIGNHFGISSLRGVTVHLDALERKGYIKRKNTARAITVISKTGSTSPNRNVVFVPLIGGITPGVPLTSTENVEGIVPVPEEVVDAGIGAFAFQVTESNMVEHHILPMDTVVIDPKCGIMDGDIVAVLTGCEISVTMFNGSECKDKEIIGKMVALIRRSQ